jgi:hypothetical protein
MKLETPEWIALQIVPLPQRADLVNKRNQMREAAAAAVRVDRERTRAMLLELANEFGAMDRAGGLIRAIHQFRLQLQNNESSSSETKGDALRERAARAGPLPTTLLAFSGECDACGGPCLIYKGDE